ncbi:MAG: adenine phosphoribosyltransferase [Candidatus Niyogibacteria bacterium]|nr:adenine phosphoribosyltransferase [Candidatus Niyogibacteria bacterium]
MDILKNRIREIPDWPEKGVSFKDITPLLMHPPAFQMAVDRLVDEFDAASIDKVAAIDARGFLIGALVAYFLDAGLVLVRKQGKLPPPTIAESYELEYGQNTLEIRKDSVLPEERVLVVDDVLATGGTAAATAELIRKAGGLVAGFGFLLELSDLNGRHKLQGEHIVSLLLY